jgi:hypothetical protein
MAGDAREQAGLLVEPQRLPGAHGRRHVHALERAAGDERALAEQGLARGVARPLLGREPDVGAHGLEIPASTGFVRLDVKSVRHATAPSMPCFVRSVPTRSMRSARAGEHVQISYVALHCRRR